MEWNIAKLEYIFIKLDFITLLNSKRATDRFDSVMSNNPPFNFGWIKTSKFLLIVNKMPIKKAEMHKFDCNDYSRVLKKILQYIVTLYMPVIGQKGFHYKAIKFDRYHVPWHSILITQSRDNCYMFFVTDIVTTLRTHMLFLN